MSDVYFNTMKRLRRALRAGDLEAVERGVAKQLRKLPNSPFHTVLDVSISNKPTEAARVFDRFFKRESKRFEIAASYTEMNGFDINPDCWYCDVFAYARNGGHKDYDWLSDWQSEASDEYQINGLEKLQTVYELSGWYSGSHYEDLYSDARDICGLMVVVKFQRFVEAAAEMMKQLHFPLYVTAHDFDFIAEFGPNK